MSILSIPVPADATVVDALAAANRALGAYARKHRIIGGDKDGRRFPRTRLLRFEADAIVYEVEDDCEAAIQPQDAPCRVTGTETVNYPRCYAEVGYGAAAGV